jgi:hypothetical protein
MLLAARFRLKIFFRKAVIVPEPHEYFISMDSMNHLIKVKFLDRELLSKFGESTGLNPVWDFDMNI